MRKLTAFLLVFSMLCPAAYSEVPSAEVKKAPMPQELQQLARRQKALMSQMKQRIEEIEKKDPEYVRRNEQVFNRVKDSQKVMAKAVEKLEDGDAQGSLQSQADFFSDMAGTFSEGINFLRDDKEKQSPPIGTFLNKAGNQVRYPKEKKMTVGKKPFFEAKNIGKAEIVTHSTEDQKAEPDAEEESYMEASEAKVKKQFASKPDSDSGLTATGAQGGGGKGEGAEKNDLEEGKKGGTLATGAEIGGSGAGAGAGSGMGGGQGKSNASGTGGGSGGNADQNAGAASESGEGKAGEMPSQTPSGSAQKSLDPAKKTAQTEGKGNAGASGSSGLSGAAQEKGNASSGTGDANTKTADGGESKGEGSGGHAGAGSGGASGSGTGAGGHAAGGTEVGNEGLGSDAQASGGGANQILGSGSAGNSNAGAGASMGKTEGSGNKSESSGSGNAPSGTGAGEAGAAQGNTAEQKPLVETSAASGNSGSGTAGSSSSESKNAGQTFGQNAGSSQRSSSAQASSGGGNDASGAGASGGGAGTSASALNSGSGSGNAGSGNAEKGNAPAAIPPASAASGSGSGAGNAGKASQASTLNKEKGKDSGSFKGDSEIVKAEKAEAASRAKAGSAGALDPSDRPGSASETAGAGAGSGSGAGSSGASGASAGQTSGTSGSSAGNQAAQAQDAASGSGSGAGNSAAKSGQSQSGTSGEGPLANTSQIKTEKPQDPKQTQNAKPENENITKAELNEKQQNLDDTLNTAKPAKKSTRMTQSEGDEFSENQEQTEAQGSEEKQETLNQDDTISNIQEWLLQERLILQELKRFKPVKQPNNPNPPWEYYILRQRQMIEQLKQLRRRIEFIGKKDEFFIELQKLSTIANRLLELVNRGDYTEYKASGTATDDLMKKIDEAAASLEEKTKVIMPYHAAERSEMPDEYQQMISDYFKKLSEE